MANTETLEGMQENRKQRSFLWEPDKDPICSWSNLLAKLYVGIHVIATIVQKESVGGEKSE